MSYSYAQSFIQLNSGRFLNTPVPVMQSDGITCEVNFKMDCVTLQNKGIVFSTPYNANYLVPNVITSEIILNPNQYNNTQARDINLQVLINQKFQNESLNKLTTVSVQIDALHSSMVTPHFNRVLPGYVVVTSNSLIYLDSVIQFVG